MSETRSSDTTTTATTLVQLSELLEALSPRLEAFKSSIVDATGDETVINTAKGLWTVVDEAIDLLEPIDLEGLPKAIDSEEFPDAIDAEKLSTAIDTGDAGDAIDLAELYEAVDLRELWKTVDLPALRKEHKELAVAIEAFRPALLSLTFRLVRFADCLAWEGVVKLAFEVLGRNVRVAVGFRDQLAEVDLPIRQQNSHILKLDGGVVSGQSGGSKGIQWDTDRYTLAEYRGCMQHFVEQASPMSTEAVFHLCSSTRTVRRVEPDPSQPVATYVGRPRRPSRPSSTRRGSSIGPRTRGR